MGTRELPVSIDEWTRKLSLAQAQGVILRYAPRSHTIMIASRPGSRDEYVVGPEHCSCPAGAMSGVFCKHRAMWIHEHLIEYAGDIVHQLMLDEPKKGAA